MNKDLNFGSIEDFADYIVERVKFDEELFLTVVGKFEEIKNIIKEIVVVSDVDFDNICLCSPEVNDYEDEYVLDCWCDDGIVQIGCEPAKRDDKYFDLLGDETYLIENVSSNIIHLCNDSKLYFVNFDEGCDCDEHCDECCTCDCHSDKFVKIDDEDIHGFTASESTDNGYHSCSFYTNDSLSKDDIYEILKKFGF